MAGSETNHFNGLAPQVLKREVRSRRPPKTKEEEGQELTITPTSHRFTDGNDSTSDVFDGKNN